MHSQNSLKREFLKKWVRGLQRYSSSKSKENMSLLERKKAVKLAADLAMASTRNNNGIRRSYWSHALISKASNDSETSSLTKQILGGQDDNSNASHVTLKRGAIGRNYYRKKISSRKSTMCNVKKYAPRKCGPSFNNPKVRARSVAKRLVKKRTEILRGLVPGGESMDEYSLIKEALDYVLTLRAQVDVMHHIANSAQLCDDNKK